MNPPLRLDSHQHFWKYDPAIHSWMDDRMKLIQGDFLPQDLKPILDSTGFEGCIAVQASQTHAENTFLLSLAEKYDFIKGIVGWVDLQSSEVAKDLESYANHPKMKGFRHILQDEPDVNFMLRPDFLRGIGLLRDFGFTYDILIFPQHLANAYILARTYPSQHFVIDHIAKPLINKGLIDDWKSGIEKIAELENVHCKVSGMVTEADWQSWKNSDFYPYLDVILESFGTKRIMYGSDWPVCNLAASYADVLGIVESHFVEMTTNENALFFGGNATKFYDLV